MKFIDLTHTLSSDTVSWDGDCGFTLSVETDYKDCTPPDLFRVQKIEMRAGMGTHIDAPAHCIPGGKTIEALELSSLVTNCVVIDVSKEANENYVAMPEVITRFEENYGMIPQGSFVLIYTGWSKYWNDKEKYRNNLQFPSVHEDTAKLLVERNIAGLGIDTLSCDTSKNGFPVHRIILGVGKYLVENVANAGELPPTGAKIVVLPIKVQDGTEAPVRLIGLA